LRLVALRGDFRGDKPSHELPSFHDGTAVHADPVHEGINFRKDRYDFVRLKLSRELDVAAADQPWRRKDRWQ
jgi:hypothetical protein